MKEKKGFCAHVVAAPLAEVEGPVARSQGPRAEAKATRARGLANPAEDSIRQARFKTEMRAWLAVSDQHAEHMKVRKEKTTSSRKAAKKSATENDVLPSAAPAPPRQLSADELRLVDPEDCRDVLLSAAAVLGAAA